MLLETTITVNRELLNGVIWAMGGIIIALIGLVGGWLKFFYKGMMSRFDRIDGRLEPLTTQVAIHTEQIKEIKEEQHEQDKWLNNHDNRIQKIERGLHP